MIKRRSQWGLGPWSVDPVEDIRFRTTLLSLIDWDLDEYDEVGK